MTVRRLKTYAGSQGYVYQYYFVGQRPTADHQATEYVFDVTRDRKTTFPITVILPDGVVADWNGAHGRTASDSERYAAVKMRLFRAFDEMSRIQDQETKLEIDGAFLEESLASLGVD
jgi:hypothetical protein